MPSSRWEGRFYSAGDTPSPSAQSATARTTWTRSGFEIRFERRNQPAVDGVVGSEVRTSTTGIPRWCRFAAWLRPMSLPRKTTARSTCGSSSFGGCRCASTANPASSSRPRRSGWRAAKSNSRVPPFPLPVDPPYPINGNFPTLPAFQHVIVGSLRGMKIETLDHIALWVSDRDELAEFLVDRLGMHVIDRTDKFTLVGADARR